ncbi:MAG TPA: TPM domain-containing protein, partial [Desulfuromonadaceae bacterium]
MFLKRLFILTLLLILPLSAMALDVPRLMGHVNDYAGMLSPEARAALEQKLAGFERETSNQVVVLTVPSLQGDDIDRFTIHVAEQWKPGQKGKDNGVLLVLAKAERKVRIEVGMGLQGALPDITASHIIRDTMRPYLREGDFDRGITAGVDAIMAATKGEFTASPQGPPRKPHRTSPSTITLFLLAAVAALILGTFSRLLGGLAGAAGLPLAAWLSFPGIGVATLAILAAAGFAGGLLLGTLFGGMGGGGGGGYFGGW